MLIAIAEPYLELRAESLLTLFSPIDSTKLTDGFRFRLGGPAIFFQLEETDIIF